MGATLGTLARLVLAGLVLLVPTVLAGGTLGAAARAVEHAGDHRRRATAVLYGVNTLGAVAGCLATTFFMLETFGTRRTLWLAGLVNLLVAVAAGVIARSRLTSPHRPPRAPRARGRSAPRARRRLADASCSTAAAIVGFAFFLMELVWYRMLGPILGGTVYTFGLVLAMALAGIALGALAYPLVLGRREPTPRPLRRHLPGRGGLSRHALRDRRPPGRARPASSPRRRGRASGATWRDGRS